MASRPALIGIAGASCSGKSFLAARLRERLGDCTILPTDAYYKDLSRFPLEERARHNFDAPDAIDSPLFEEQLKTLAGGETVSVPTYDFTTHTRAPGCRTVQPSSYIIVEGLFALYWPVVRKLLGLKVFVEAPHDLCLERRIERDCRERGRTPESVRAQYEATVRPMFDKCIAPTRHYADLVISGEAPVEIGASAIIERVSRTEKA